MAKCRDYERHTDCPYFHKVTEPDEQVQVGTSMKRLDQHCFYCFKTERVKKVGHVASWTGRTPEWCPLAETRDKPMAKLFTEEELEELRRADAELDEEFTLTREDLIFSRQLERDAKLDRLDNRERKIAEYQAAYREANKDKIAEYQAAYREANREKYNAYMREYLRKRREAKKAASDGANIESGKANVCQCYCSTGERNFQ